MLNIDNSDKEDFIRILEARSSDSSDNDILTSSESNYWCACESSDSPNIKLGYRDSCCNTINVLTKGHKTINVLSKGEEHENLIINLISQIDNPKPKENILKSSRKL